MAYALHYREELPESVKRELDDLVSYFNHHLDAVINSNGTLKSSAIVEANTEGGSNLAADESHNWNRGPWQFDTNGSHGAFIYPPQLPASTINDFAPTDIDSAFGIEINLGGNVSLTGIKAPPGGYRRLLVLRNQSSTYTITLNHANTGSQVINRFSLPNSTDIVLGSKQTVWLIYDADNHQWGSFIDQSAGLVHIERVITDAEMKAINTTPLTILAAPGAGYTWRCIHWGGTGNVTTFGGTGVNLSLRFVGGTPANRVLGNAVTFVSVPGNRNVSQGGSTFTTQGVADTTENLAVQVFGSANAGATYATTAGMQVSALFIRGTTRN